MRRQAFEQWVALGACLSSDQRREAGARLGFLPWGRPSRTGGPLLDPRLLVAVATFKGRAGGVRELVMRTFRTSRLVAALAFEVAPDLVLMTDGSAVYRKLAKALGIRHEAVNVAAGERVRGTFHVQGVNRWHASLKTWIGRFQGVATKYLANYLGWHRLVADPREDLGPGEVLKVAAGRMRLQPG